MLEAQCSPIGAQTRMVSLTERTRPSWTVPFSLIVSQAIQSELQAPLPLLACVLFLVRFPIFFAKHLRRQFRLLVILACESPVHLSAFRGHVVHLVHCAFRPHLTGRYDRL